LGADATTSANEIVGYKTTFDKANDKLQIDCFDSTDNKRQYTPEQLASHILIYLKECAEEYLTRKPFKRESGDLFINDDNTTSSKQGKKSASPKVVLTKVVIGIPANYTERKKDAIRSAASMAGFDEVRILSFLFILLTFHAILPSFQVHLMIESTAAAMSYGLLVAGRKNALIVDIGGGTTDLTLLTIDEGVYQVGR
jgi:molecular chaperone DnaK (HSP70)